MLDPTILETLQALALGFAFAGLLASAFEFLTARRAGLALLQGGGIGALACVPVVVFAAPFLLLRATLAARGQGRFGLALVAGVVAGLWSLMSGRLVLDLALGFGA
jgi:hypothetical protein